MLTEDPVDYAPPPDVERVTEVNQQAHSQIADFPAFQPLCRVSTAAKILEVIVRSWQDDPKYYTLYRSMIDYARAE